MSLRAAPVEMQLSLIPLLSSKKRLGNAGEMLLLLEKGLIFVSDFSHFTSDFLFVPQRGMWAQLTRS